MTRTRRANCLIGYFPAPVAPSLSTHVSSRAIARCLAEGYLVTRRPLRVLSMIPPTDASVWRGVAYDEIGLQRNGTMSSSVMNLDSN
ncbi:hypothetical protein TNCV_3039131 [Trichonephila clavipes]|nr:hypothetical protein TNCV_3039131 [Trichonephila clavipes]